MRRAHSIAAPLPGGAVLDRVQFPQETIERGGGDCDDLSVLYSALLASIGIEAAIIAYPDHVLVMFNTGIYEKNRHLLSIDTTLTIMHNNTLWIPVETTMPDKGFTAAWQTAGKEFHTSLSEGRQTPVIDLSKAWKTFPPMPLPEIRKLRDVAGIDKAIVDERRVLERAADSTQKEMLSLVESRAASVKDFDRAALLNGTGVRYARIGNYKRAQTCFEQSLALNKNAAAIRNYANTLLLNGEDDRAIGLMDSITRKDPVSRIAMNRALCLFAKAQTPQQLDEFVAAMKQVAAKLPPGHSLD